MLDVNQYKVKEALPALDASTGSQNILPQVTDTAASTIDVSQFKTSEEPSFFDTALRNAATWGSRTLEQFFGGPGDTANFIRSSLQDPGIAPESIFGMAIPQLSDNLIPEWDKRLSQGIKQSLQPKPGVLTSIPTVGSAEIEAFAKTASKGYLSPQAEWEEKAGEVFKNLGRLMFGRALPGPRNPGPPPRLAQARKFAQDLGTSIAAETAKEGVNLFGGSDESQEKAKLATMFTAGMMLQGVSGRTADNYVNGLYKERDSLIPQGASFNSVALENGLENFINRRLKHGGPTPEKNTVLHVTEEFLSRIKQRQGQMTMEELLEMGRNVNRNSAAVYMQPIDKAGIKAARSLYGELNGVFNNILEGQLATLNPEALAIHRSAQSGWGALQQSRRVQNNIRNATKSTPFKTGIASVLGGAILAPKAAASAVAGLGVGAGILSTGETLTRIYLSPTMRHYYSQVVMNAMRENLPGMMHALKKLDDTYYREANQKDKVDRRIGNQRVL